MFPGDKTPGLEFGHFRIGGGIDLPFFVGSFVRNFVGMNAVPEVLYPLETFLTPFRPWIKLCGARAIPTGRDAPHWESFDRKRICHMRVTILAIRLSLFQMSEN